MPRTVFMVCYDICGRDSDKRLRQIYKTLRGYGDHLQYSVFRCVLSDRQLAMLEGELLDIIRPSTDQVMFVPLGRADTERSWAAWTLGLPLDRPERTVRIV